MFTRSGRSGRSEHLFYRDGPSIVGAPAAMRDLGRLPPFGGDGIRSYPVHDDEEVGVKTYSALFDTIVASQAGSNKDRKSSRPTEIGVG